MVSGSSILRNPSQIMQQVTLTIDKTSIMDSKLLSSVFGVEWIFMKLEKLGKMFSVRLSYEITLLCNNLHVSCRVY